MSLTANRFATKPSQRISVPKVQQYTKEEAQRLSLLDRVLLQEHQRHAARLAEIRTVADKLAAYDDVVRAVTDKGATIDYAHVVEGFVRYSVSGGTYGNGVRPVHLRAVDATLSDWRHAAQQDAVANTLVAAGWRIVEANAYGREISLDRVVFMHGRRAVQTTCMRAWVLGAIDAGLITAATAGTHPASDTGTALTAGRSTAPTAAPAENAGA